jgi:hypothetical protein
VNELDQFWSSELARLSENARKSGREVVADYLELKARNDIVRSIGVAWLIDSFIEAASDDLASGRGITIERDEPHQFTLRNATMTGSKLKLQLGVRCLTLEAGWTRTPSDGFMKGGALAAARLIHFGMARSGEDIGLFAGDVAPVWRSFDERRAGNQFTSQDVERHFRTFTG